MLELADRLASGASVFTDVGVRLSLRAPKMNWDSNLAYIVGLITTDGNLSKDGRHLTFTSKDLDQIQTFCSILKLKNKISTRYSSYNSKGKYYVVQFGNIRFYKFLLSIGLTPNKTKTLSSLTVPEQYFTDFLRGHLDGDGYTTSFWDSKWKNNLRLYTAFLSASKNHLEWIEQQINKLYKIKGTLWYKGKSTFELKFAKKSSIALLNKLYYQNNLVCLKRKRLKVEHALNTIATKEKPAILERISLV